MCTDTTYEDIKIKKKKTLTVSVAAVEETCFR